MADKVSVFPECQSCFATMWQDDGFGPCCSYDCAVAYARVLRQAAALADGIVDDFREDLGLPPRFGRRWAVEKFYGSQYESDPFAFHGRGSKDV